MIFRIKSFNLANKSNESCTLSVKALPSRPSGKSTVKSFLSSLTTTLEMDQKVNKTSLTFRKFTVVGMWRGSQIRCTNENSKTWYTN